MGAGALPQSLVEATTAHVQPVVQSLSLSQLTLAAWHRRSFDGSQIQLGCYGAGTGVPPSLASALPPALPLHAHSSPAVSH